MRESLHIASYKDRLSSYMLIVAAFLCAANLCATESSLADRYPGDLGIEKDPAVLFADNFESGDLRKWDQVRSIAG